MIPATVRLGAGGKIRESCDILARLDLPGSIKKTAASRHNLRYIEGDGCNVEGIADQSFDFVFSNSVIEHVGGPERRRAFANEIRRIGRSYWVQTPSIWFPIEAHNGMQFWWFYPQSVRRALIAGWRIGLNIDRQ